MSELDAVIAAYCDEVARTRPAASMWSATHFVIEPLQAVTTDPETFRELAFGIAEVMAVREDSRFEQYAVPVCGRVLAGRPDAMRAVIAGAHAIAARAGDPGWFVQLVVVALAGQATDDGVFEAAWHRLAALACEVARSGRSPGYPIAIGVAALIERGELDALPGWLELLAPLARAAKARVYGLFEHGIAGALARGTLDANDVGDALRLAIAMFDHGLDPSATLAALGTPLQLDVATRLARAGVDPCKVIGNGFSVFAALEWLDEDGAERLGTLAIELHRRGLRALLFDDGLDVLVPLERDFHGLARPALELVEQMIARDLEPAIVMRWALPRVLGTLRPVWAAGAVIELARALVELGVSPEPAITYAARPLVELSPDLHAFRRLAGAVVALVAQLHALGIDHREVLFRDVAHLTEAGRDAQTFGELLAAFADVLATWTRAGLDPGELLQRGIPAAAQAAAGRPWALAVALRTASRLGREDRAVEAVTLLEVGVHTAAQLGAEDATAFEAALGSVEARYAALPVALTERASIAAGLIAGTDVDRLDRALAAIAAAHVRHGDALIAHAAALPELARMAGDADGLVALIDALIDADPGGHGARIAALAAQVCQTPSAGVRVIADLARWAAATPSAGRTLDRFATLGRLASAATLVDCVGVVHEALRDLDDPRPVLQLLEHARSEVTLREICALAPPLVRDAREVLLDGLARAIALVARNPFAWTYLVAPILVTAKQHAGPLLYAVAALPSRQLEHEVDLAVVRDLVTQRGVRALDLVTNLLWPALHRKIIPSLGEHRDLIARYLDEVGFADAEVYAHYVAIATDDDAATRSVRIAALRGELGQLTAAIYRGEACPAQRAHPLFGVALQHVFPAAVSSTRRMWEQLVATMADRPGDVTALWPHGHAAPLEVAAGSWQLAPGTHELSAFGWFARVCPPDDVEPQPLASLGWQLLTAWSEGRLAREPARSELVRALLSHAEGLPGTATDSAAQLLAIRQVAADRTSALVEQAVLAARAESDERAVRLIETRLAPAPRIGPGLVKAIARTLAAAGALGEDAAIERLRGQLAMFELPDDPLTTLRHGDLATALHALPAKRVAIEPGKELGRIHADLVGQELAAMNAALATALEYRASSQRVAIDVTITKRAIHAPIGLTGGVCVASDVELWDTPGFLHLALWQDRVCAGSVHLLVLEEDGRRYLALPGINPSLALLGRVEADVLVRALLDRARTLAREAGLAGVWIPTASSIHSNRRAVHDALVELDLPARRTRGHAFSYRPYAYRIDEVWELTEMVHL